jgi:hypothetical protein
MNTKDELIKILVNNAQGWNKEESQDRALIYVDDFLNEVESKFKLLPIPDVVVSLKCDCKHSGSCRHKE